MNENKFQVEYNNKNLNIEPVSIGGQSLFKISLDNQPSFLLQEQKITLINSGLPFQKANNKLQNKSAY